MSVEIPGAQDAERDRQQRARELAADCGEDWAEEYRPGSAGCHELLDRAALLADTMERHLLGHPACVARADWYLRAEQAASLLRALYQEIGAEHLGADGPGGEPEGKRGKDGAAPSVLTARKLRK